MSDIKFAQLPMPHQQLSKGMAQGMPQGMTQGLPQGMTQGLPQGMTQGLPQGMTQGLPQGMTQGLPQGMTQGLPQGMTQGLPQGMTQGVVRRLSGFPSPPVQVSFHHRQSRSPVGQSTPQATATESRNADELPNSNSNGGSQQIAENDTIKQEEHEQKKQGSTTSNNSRPFAHPDLLLNFPYQPSQPPLMSSSLVSSIPVISPFMPSPLGCPSLTPVPSSEAIPQNNTFRSAIFVQGKAVQDKLAGVSLDSPERHLTPTSTDGPSSQPSLSGEIKNESSSISFSTASEVVISRPVVASSSTTLSHISGTLVGTPCHPILAFHSPLFRPVSPAPTQQQQKVSPTITATPYAVDWAQHQIKPQASTQGPEHPAVKWEQITQQQEQQRQQQEQHQQQLQLQQQQLQLQRQQQQEQHHQQQLQLQRQQQQEQHQHQQQLQHQQQQEQQQQQLQQEQQQHALSQVPSVKNRRASPRFPVTERVSVQGVEGGKYSLNGKRIGRPKVDRGDTRCQECGTTTTPQWRFFTQEELLKYPIPLKVVAGQLRGGGNGCSEPSLGSSVWLQGGSQKVSLCNACWLRVHKARQKYQARAGVQKYGGSNDKRSVVSLNTGGRSSRTTLKRRAGLKKNFADGDFTPTRRSARQREQGLTSSDDAYDEPRSPAAMSPAELMENISGDVANVAFLVVETVAGLALRESVQPEGGHAELVQLAPGLQYGGNVHDQPVIVVNEQELLLLPPIDATASPDQVECLHRAQEQIGLHLVDFLNNHVRVDQRFDDRDLCQCFRDELSRIQFGLEQIQTHVTA